MFCQRAVGQITEIQKVDMGHTVNLSSQDPVDEFPIFRYTYYGIYYLTIPSRMYSKRVFKLTPCRTQFPNQFIKEL